MAGAVALGTMVGADTAQPAGVIGPNAVLQLRTALDARLGPDSTYQIFAAAGQERWLRQPPADMIDERVPADLFRALWHELPKEDAADIAREAGRRTADYILAHRIPKPAQWLLKHLPALLAGPILLKAIQKSAWTFAGSGHCTTQTGRPLTIEIAGNPLIMPGCIWHVAVFERLFRKLVAATTSVHLTDCVKSGGQTCRFEIHTARPVSDS